MANLRYPDLPPVTGPADAGLTGLGANWNAGGEGSTPWIDYMVFQAYRPTYDGKAILESIKNGTSGTAAGKSKVDSASTSVYLYMPTNVAISYSAQYSNTKFGVAGVMAANMLGASGSEEVATTLKNAAGAATPEFGFNAVGTAASSISQMLGTSGGPSGSDLAAVTQGKVFNPYEEQIFNGISFRAHSFSWKLIARDKKEAETIDSIVKYFKTAMLPSYDDKIGSLIQKAVTPPPAVTPSTSTPPSGSLGEAVSGDPFTKSTNRFLTVPGRVRVDFVRVFTGAGKAPSSIKLFNIKDCIIDSIGVNYTPDGSYVNTNDGYVPALEMSMGLKEISLVTAEDVAKYGF